MNRIVAFSFGSNSIMVLFVWNWIWSSHAKQAKSGPRASRMHSTKSKQQTIMEQKHHNIIRTMIRRRTTLASTLIQLACCVVTSSHVAPSNHNVQREVILQPEDRPPVGTAQVCRPRHVHLSIGRTQNTTHSSMTVSFSISPACIDETSTVGAVRVGDVMIEGDPNDVVSYNASRSDHNHYYSDLYYHIEIDDLQPGRKYSYQCLLLQKEEPSIQQYLRQDREVLNERIISRSNISTFHTPPAPGQWPQDRSIKFAVMGDLATKPHSRETIWHLDRDKSIDCILLAGDISYANNHHHIWDEW